MSEYDKELMKTLSDPTRMSIYSAVAGAPGQPMTVLQLSDRVGVHPNVVRLHLEKLTKAGLLSSSLKKKKSGGRPARQYYIGEKVLNFQYPPRDYQLLAEMALTSLADAPHSDEAAREKGRQIGARALAASGIDPATADRRQLVTHFGALNSEMGLFPDISLQDDGTIDMKIYNCVFKELLGEHAGKVCRLHHSMMAGLCESHFGEVSMNADRGLAEGGTSCGFQISPSLLETASQEKSD